MSDELDPGLRRLFAETADHPADETFVAAVTARTAQEPRIGLAVRRFAAEALPALALGAVVAGLGLALQLGYQVIAPLLSPSPTGVAAGLGLAVAGFICAGVLAPLLQRRL